MPRRPNRPPFAVLALAVLLVAAALPAFAAEETRSFEKSFTADAGERLRLANLLGSVRLVAGDGDAVVVRATAHVDAGDGEENRKILSELGWVRDPDRRGGWALSYPVDRYRTFTYPRSSGLLRWRGRSTTKFLGKRVTVANAGGPVVYVDLEITYPARVPLGVRLSMGSVDGGDLYGDLDVDTGSADVTLASFNGDLVIDTGSGDVEVGAFHGDAGNLDTGSGDVTVGRVTAGKLRVDTGSGDVLLTDGEVGDLVVDTGSGSIRVDGVAVETADLDTGSGDVLLRGALSTARRVIADTGSGDVEIYGGADFTFEVSADQGSGDLEIGYDDAELRRDGRKLIGATRGAKRTRVSIDTGSGDAVVAP
ncbi:MAG TPA: DUF4097 family beta strand repeat-containing protein [Thermoanaerobaculia bacterium]|nr:DUF4097 family beta strand repeat-containing protein [Thermoanaerobaculia bacterium]